MNAIERNLVYNSLCRILKENDSLENALLEDSVEYSLSDAKDLYRILLGRDAVLMYDDGANYEKKTTVGYIDELDQLVSFIKQRIEGKDPTLCAYDVLVMGMLERSRSTLADIVYPDDGEDEQVKE